MLDDSLIVDIQPTEDPLTLQVTRVRSCPICCCIRLSPYVVTYVDPEVWCTINRKGWHLKLSRYSSYATRKVYENGHVRYEYLHRLITKCPPHMEVHHKNGNSLDNRLLNTQILSPHEHTQLTRMRRIAKWPKPFHRV